MLKSKDTHSKDIQTAEVIPVKDKGKGKKMPKEKCKM